MLLRPGLKRNLKIILYIFTFVPISLIIYSYFSISSEISFIKTTLSTLENGVNAIFASLMEIYSISLIETVFVIIFFIAAAIVINYLLNWYFIEKKHALIDGLTEIYNRKAMKKWLRTEIQRAKRYRHPLSVAMIDLDHFKLYNDKNGHVRGDKLLKKIAKIFKRSTREIDFVGRYGGEEFIIIFPETEYKGAVIVAERIRKAVEEARFAKEQVMPKGQVTISMGLVTFHKSFEEEKMIHEADKLLYEAKQRGRNLLIHKVYN